MERSSTAARTALVTGSSRGIGRATAVKFLEQGYNVCFNNFEEDFSFSGQMAERYKGRCMFYRATLANGRDLQPMVDAVSDRFGGIDILVNNAGIYTKMPFSDTDFSGIEETIRVNLLGAAQLTQRAVPFLKKSASARIIFIGSMASFSSRSQGGNVAYAMSKAGIIGLMHSLANEYAPDILVNAVVPGYIDTKLFHAVNDQKSIERKIASVPLNRIGTAEEVAAAVTFLASEGAAYITGQCLHVNGGAYMS